MAGLDPEGAFDGDEFRAQIRSVMLMGLPEDPELRPTFLMPATVTNAAADPGNRPWDFQQPKVHTVTPTPIRVVCGVKAADGQQGYTTVGKFTAREVELSMFEAEWAQVGAPTSEGGFEYVLIGGNRYKRAEELEPQGLFEVTVHRVRVVAADI